MKLDFLEVTWRDAEVDNGWSQAEDIKAPTELTKSYGFFIKETQQYLTIAADYDKATKHFNRFMSIPLNMVVKKRKIKL